MAVYQIGYTDDGSIDRTIDLLPGNDGVRIEWKTEINRNVSSTGIYENVVQNTLRFVSFEAYFQEAAFHKLETFMSFAQQGQSFSFTKDTSKGSELLAADIVAGDTTMLVTDGLVDQFDAGDFIIIRDSEGTKWDVCEIDSIDVDEITVVDSIQHDYSSGSPISWYYYFSALYLLDEDFDPNRDGTFWNHTFNCVEVR